VTVSNAGFVEACGTDVFVLVFFFFFYSMSL